MIIVPKREIWTQQPRGLVRPNRRFFAGSKDVLWTMRNGEYDYANQRAGVFNGVSYGTSDRGVVGVVASSGSSYGGYWETTQNAGAFTVIGEFTPSVGNTGGGALQWASTAGGSNGPRLFLKWDLYGYIVYWADAYRISDSVNPSTENRTHRYVIRWDGSTLYYTSNTGYSTSITNSPVYTASHIWFGNGFPASIIAEHSLFSWIEKDIGESGAKQVVANPWVLFDTVSRPVFVGASGGGGTDLYGAASGTSQASGTATLSAQVELAGVGVALAGGSATASATVPISATGISVSGGDAALTATIAIAAAGLAQAAGAAGLSASVLLAGSGAALAAGNATLAAQLSALASGSAQASGSATLSGGAPGAISAFGTSVAGGSGTLEVTVQLAATGGAQAGGTAMLSGGAPGGIAASGGAIAGGSGTLAVTVALTAAGFVQAMGAGAMLVSVQLVATGSATTGGSAVLRLLGAAVPVIDSRYIARAVRRDYTARYGQGSRYGRESG